MSGQNQNNTRPQGLAPLNPERLPPLQAKFAKSIGKDLKSIVITYDADGVNVNVNGMDNTVFASLQDADIAAYRAIKAKANEPSEEEKLRALKNKFELRLNKEFPRNGGPASGKDADIQTFLDGLNFKERRALMMTQKQFEKSYPNGYTAV